MASGDALVRAVSYSLEFLGFTVTITEKEGRHDIEFHEKDFYAIAEIKGLQGSADIEDLRQLIDFHLRKLSERKNKLVAYLIVNHHRNLPPDKRGAPFTREVINAVKTSYPFVRLLTTLDIYRLIERVLRSEISKETAREIIKSISFNSGQPASHEDR